MSSKRTAIGFIVAGAIALVGTVSLAEKDPAPQAPVPLTEEAPASPVTREQIRERINNALDKLVNDKVITQEQKDAVLEAMDKKRQCVVKERDGKPGKKHLKCKRKSVLKGLTEEGIITREQADAIRKAIKSVYENMKKPDQTR